MTTSNNRRWIFVILALSLLVVVLLAVVIHLAVRKTGESCTVPYNKAVNVLEHHRIEETEKTKWYQGANSEKQIKEAVNGESCSVTYNKAVNVLEYHRIDEAAKTKWHQGANSEKQITDAVNGGYMMIKADISLRASDNVPLVGSISDDYTLNQWLDVILEYNIGLQLMVTNIEEVEPTLSLLEERMDRRPVFIGADIIKGPGGRQPVDPKRLLEIVNQVYPDITLSLGWTSDSCDNAYGRSKVEDMWSALQSIKQPVNFLVRSTTLKESWPDLKWLLEKSNNATMTVMSCPGDNNRKTSSYDMLLVYNDYDKKKVFYDIPLDDLMDLQKLISTAGMPMHYFNITNRDAAKVTWLHGVNSLSELQKAINDGIMMFEADINLGVGNQTGIPIMAHDAGTYSDLTFDGFVQEALKTKSGLKLDFKTLNVLEPSLQILQKRKKSIKQPVWINADIFQGFFGDVPVNATEFIKVVESTFPECVLSIGWTTERSSSVRPEDDMFYSRDDVQFVADFCSSIKQPITFSIRAAAAKKSWVNLQWLLDQSRSYTLTIWHISDDSLSKEDMNYVRQNSDHSRVFFDLTEDVQLDI